MGSTEAVLSSCSERKALYGHVLRLPGGLYFDVGYHFLGIGTLLSCGWRRHKRRRHKGILLSARVQVGGNLWRRFTGWSYAPMSSEKPPSPFPSWLVLALIQLPGFPGSLRDLLTWIRALPPAYPRTNTAFWPQVQVRARVAVTVRSYIS